MNYERHIDHNRRERGGEKGRRMGKSAHTTKFSMDWKGLELIGHQKLYRIWMVFEIKGKKNIVYTQFYKFTYIYIYILILNSNRIRAVQCGFQNVKMYLALWFFFVIVVVWIRSISRFHVSFVLVQFIFPFHSWCACFFSFFFFIKFNKKNLFYA